MTYSKRRVPYWISWFALRRGISHCIFRLHFVVSDRLCSSSLLFFVHFSRREHGRFMQNRRKSQAIFIEWFLLDLKYKSMLMLFSHSEKSRTIRTTGSINLCITILGTNRYSGIIYCLLRWLRSNDANNLFAVNILFLIFFRRCVSKFDCRPVAWGLILASVCVDRWNWIFLQDKRKARQAQDDRHNNDHRIANLIDFYWCIIRERVSSECRVSLELARDVTTCCRYELRLSMQMKIAMTNNF